VRFDYVGGRPILVAEKGQGVAALLDGHTGLPLTQTTGTIAAVAKAAVLNGGLISIQRIEHYDRYWYSTGDPRSDARPLPVLRLIFDDPSSTWLHIAPQTGELLARSGSGSRTYRWLFSALHSFDVPLLLSWRPLRDGLMWLFSAFGLAVSITGIVIGWKYLRPARRA
jgi:hypothetical protein